MNNKQNIPRVLAVIPARGGSKRLPKKNILKIGVHPLIAYTITAAKEAEHITDWLVSTDDDDILRVAKQYGAPTPFTRPKHLATDEVRNIEVVLHALDYMEKETEKRYDIIILLQPTSPIRSAKHIDEAVKQLWQSDLPSLASVKGPFQKSNNLKKMYISFMKHHLLNTG